MSEVNHEIPASLLKLETLRLDKEMHYGQLRMVDERVRSIESDIRDLRLRLAEFTIYQRRASPDQVGQVEKQIACHEAMLEIAKAKLQELQDDCGASDVFDQVREHLRNELNAWGVSL